jgi:hypothetical protein
VKCQVTAVVLTAHVNLAANHPIAPSIPFKKTLLAKPSRAPSIPDPKQRPKNCDESRAANFNNRIENKVCFMTI